MRLRTRTLTRLAQCALLACVIAVLFPAPVRAGIGKIQSVVLAILEQKGITSGGVYTPPSTPALSAVLTAGSVASAGQGVLIADSSNESVGLYHGSGENALLLVGGTLSSNSGRVRADSGFTAFNGSDRMVSLSSGLSIASFWGITWSNGSSSDNTTDLRLQRGAASILTLDDGSSGPASLRFPGTDSSSVDLVGVSGDTLRFNDAGGKILDLVSNGTFAADLSGGESLPSRLRSGGSQSLWLAAGNHVDFFPGGSVSTSPGMRLDSNNDLHLHVNSSISIGTAAAGTGDDTYLHRARAKTWRFTSDGASAAGSVEIAGTLLLDNGTEGLPALSFTGDDDNGIYRIGANNYAFVANAAKVLEIDAGTIKGYSSGTQILHVDASEMRIVQDLQFSSTGDVTANDLQVRARSATELVVSEIGGTTTLARVVFSHQIATWDADARWLVAASGGTAATIGTVGGHSVYQFDPDDDETITLPGNCPVNYSGGTVTITIEWAAASATSGDAKLEVSVENMNGVALGTDSFAAAVSGTATTGGTAGTLNSAWTFALTNTQADALATGPFRLRITRLGTDAADTMAGDLHIVRATMRDGQ